jgi:Spy/CpxP family protein refolding chaperone
MKAKAILTLALIVTAGTLWAQPAPADLPEPPPGPQGFMLQAGPMPPPGGGGEIHIRTGGRGFGMSGPGGFPGGAWWKDSQLVQAIGLSDQQVQQIEKTFQDHRMQLVDLHANLEKAELQMEPMMESDQPNEAQVNAQIDKVAQARAALEKSNAQMLFAVRRVLTPDQWKKLQAQHHERRPGAMGLRGPGGPREEMGFSRSERTRRPRTPQPGQPAQPAPAPAPQPPQE